jgi:hypothetical protein
VSETVVNNTGHTIWVTDYFDTGTRYSGQQSMEVASGQSTGFGFCGSTNGQAANILYTEGYMLIFDHWGRKGDGWKTSWTQTILTSTWDSGKGDLVEVSWPNGAYNEANCFTVAGHEWAQPVIMGPPGSPIDGATASQPIINGCTCNTGYTLDCDYYETYTINNPANVTPATNYTPS